MERIRAGGSRIVLASRSPRRRELLALVAPAEAIEVLPPSDAREPGFEGLNDLPAIEKQLIEIARGKAADVCDQLAARSAGGGAARDNQVVVAADTVVVVDDPRTNRPRVLGQPPDDDTWADVVRGWFVNYLIGRRHMVITGLRVQVPERTPIERVVRTEVEFRADAARWLEWYIGTGEPRGKAGGYGIQGAGSVFVSGVTGSISNVIGLPLEALLEVFEELERSADQC